MAERSLPAGIHAQNQFTAVAHIPAVPALRTRRPFMSKGRSRIDWVWDKAASSAGQLERRVLAGADVQDPLVVRYRTIQLIRLLTDWCWDGEP